MEHYSEYKDNGVKWDIPMHNGLNMNVPDGNGVKGQKHEQCCMAFALTGRMYPPSITQGVALGWKLVALSGRRLQTKTGDDGSFLDYQTLSGRRLPTKTM